MSCVSRSDLSWDFLLCPAHTSCRRKTWRNTESISRTTRWAPGHIRFLRWDHGSRLLLTANRGYFGGRPGVDGISYRVIPEELTAVAEFERGNLDALNVPRAGVQAVLSRREV